MFTQHHTSTIYIMADSILQSKRDLGFIEGDLIECLNAGDGSWWVGRLYRDRRTVGSFPSNFVEVLPRDFRPTTKSVPPLPASNTPSPKNTPSKSRTFRKPFEAYAKAPHYTSAKQPETFRDPPVSRPAEKPVQETPKQRERQNSSREPPRQRPRENSVNSFIARSVHDDIVNVPSPPQVHGYGSRGPSPSPTPSMHRPPSRRASPGHDSPPPPAPPPHRHVNRHDSNEGHHHHHDRMSRHGSNTSFNPQDVSRRGSAASYNDRHELSRHPSYASYEDRPYDQRLLEYHGSRTHSPQPHHMEDNHMTPSPLREAMDGVMQQLDQLEGLGGTRANSSPVPPEDPWAPECFDLSTPRSKRQRQDRARPMTSMGIAHSDEGYETWSGDSSYNTSHHNGRREKGYELPHLNNYVDRMEKQFETMYLQDDGMSVMDLQDAPPPPPPKGQQYARPKSSAGEPAIPEHKLRARKSAYEVGGGIARTFTTKTNATHASSGNQSNASSSTQSSARTLWSGVSAGGFSSTSAGSLVRTNQRAQSALGMHDAEPDRPETPFTGVTYHSSHASQNSGAPRPVSQAGMHDDPTAGLGGLVQPTQPKTPKRNIFKKIFESAKTGVASNRGSFAGNTISTPSSGKSSPFTRSQAPVSIMTGMGPGRDAARDMGLGGGVDWVQVRRDVNRSNSLSKIERAERADRCQMQDHPVLNPVDELYEGIEGDEGVDGMPVHNPVNYQAISFSQVDKTSRFVNEPPPMTTAATLSTTYVCRPYRSEVQRLRAIFTWVAEKICWEEDFEGEIDTARVIQAKRGCAEEYAVLVMEMCAAVGLHCEVVRGYLKSPGDLLDLNMMPRPNHWWNAVIVDNEWRIMDTCLASPSHPKRGLYSSVNGSAADPWWFLARPTEMCWTHVPEHHDQQHIVPPVAHETLLNLPCTCPAFFRNSVEMVDYNTSCTRIEDLEMVHVKFNVPADVEVAAEVEARGYTKDADGDVFESGDVVKKKALVQAEWFNGVKRYTVKALLPGDEGQGTLKIYAGKRGLMQSIKDIPHPLAFALPIVHMGENPAYEFVTRHPTPHAQRHDIYVVQPQCQRLALNNTFVFAIRQHPNSVTNGPQSVLTPASNPGGTSPVPYARPSSAMSMNNTFSVSASVPSSASGTVAGKKPAKLAIQTPGGKILRLMRKEDRKGISVGGRGFTSCEEISDGGTWETIIKCSEKGVWRGLVLADRTARWCVFAEWVCMG